MRSETSGLAAGAGRFASGWDGFLGANGGELAAAHWVLGQSGPIYRDIDALIAAAAAGGGRARYLAAGRVPYHDLRTRFRQFDAIKTSEGNDVAHAANRFYHAAASDPQQLSIIHVVNHRYPHGMLAAGWHWPS